MRPLRLFNTLQRQVVPFEPIETGRVGLYTCGPTVYNAPHIGNLRTFLFEDLLRRTLEWFGYDVTHVMNLTDVEDKIIDSAHRAGQSIDEFTQPHIDAFFADLELLNVEPAHHYPRATHHIDGMIELIERLIERDFAYRAEGGVFFRIDRFERYGALSRIDLSQTQRGQRVADDEYGKDDVRDFVLWKSAKANEPSWDSPWGPGRPGWHIECSAMSRYFLGDTFDMHCGGVDNIFPHHENEIAQSCCALDREYDQFARYWLHSEHLMVDGAKMSKSKGNMYRLEELMGKGVSPRALRYLFLSVHYRRQLNFTMDSLEAADAALRRLDELAQRLVSAPDGDADHGDVGQAAQELRDDFAAALADDLNASEALGALFRFVKRLNRAIDEGISAGDRTAAQEALADVDRVLGVLDAEAWAGRLPQALGDDDLSPERIEALIAERNASRVDKNWARADEIRDELAAAGIQLVDGPEGTTWRRG